MPRFVHFTCAKLIKNAKGKKVPVGMPLYKNKTVEEYAAMCKPEHKVKCVLCGKINNITVFDFDKKEAYFDAVERFPELKTCYTVQTSKGFHIYTEYVEAYKTTTNLEVGIDVRNDDSIVFGTGTVTDFGTEYKFYQDGGTRLDVPAPAELYNFIKPSDKKVSPPLQKKRKLLIDNQGTPVNEVINSPVNEVVTLGENQNEEIIDDLKRCADVVPVENINNRDTWLKLMYALRDFKKVAIYMSERTTRADLKPFDEEYYEKIMNDDTGGNTIDTFFYYARLGNAGLANEIKEKWFKKNKDLELRDFANATTDYEKADLIMQTIGDNFVYVEKELFVFDDNTQRWRLDEDKEFAKLLIKKELYKMGTSHLDELNKELATQTKQTDANKVLGLISSCASLMKANQCVKEISNVCTAVVQNLSARNDKTEFDKNPYLFAFENLVYDFKTGVFREHKKGDFIIMTCGYDYHEPTFEQTKKITEVIERIFVEEEVRRHYISVLRNGCIGICPEKFIIANGSGRNGKGMLNDMFRDTIGEYGYKGSAATLTEKTKEGANPAVANMHKKRFLSFQEPDVKQQLNVATIKEISGGGELNARQLYSKKTKTVLHGVVVLETNEKPDLNGSDADSTALKDRICDVPFDSTFVNKPEEVDEELNMFLKDPELKEAEFVEGHRCALFDYICTYKGVETIYVPDIIAERSAEYLRGNDMIFTFMLENYEKVTDDTEVVQLKDAYELFKSSNYFINLDKKEKRSLNQSNFVEKVSRHSYFKKDFREKLQTNIIKEKYGKALIRTCLVNWKEKYEEVEEEED